MQAIDLLKDYQRRLQPYLEEFFEEKIKQSKQVDPLATQTLKIIKKFVLSGGKRLRPALVYYGYLAAKGEKNEGIVKASISIELIHSFLLIHDDIIDRDDKRHGGETVHVTYKKMAKRFFPSADQEHFGNSMAIVAGDLAMMMGNEVLFNMDFPPEVILKALNKLQEIVYVTIPGEMVDVVLEAQGRATEEEIMRMYEGKTARYTFEGPLQLGAVLAGADERFVESLSAYAIPLGIAFQIRDDILGVFGDEKKLGKPVGSDIIEGKQTILVVKALEKGNRKQKTRVKALLGKTDLTQVEIEEFRQLVTETGALDYANKKCQDLIDESLEALGRLDLQSQEAKGFLEGIAQFIVKRHH